MCRWYNRISDGTGRNFGHEDTRRHLLLEHRYTRLGVAVLLFQGLLKENVDGEMLEWATSRIRATDHAGSVIVLTDEVPVDDTTLACNQGMLLHRQLREVVARTDDIAIQAVALIYEKSTLYASTRANLPIWWKSRWRDVWKRWRKFQS
jgi:hypothetical protein